MRLFGDRQTISWDAGSSLPQNSHAALPLATCRELVLRNGCPPLLASNLLILLALMP